MIKLIINIIILAVLAVFVAMNVSHTATINLFGTVFEGISVVAVILLSLVGGVIYSFLYYVVDYLTRNSKLRIRKKRMQNKEKEKELKFKESSIENSKLMVQEQTGLPDSKKKSLFRKRSKTMESPLNESDE